jgi:hypothetical protein
MVSIEAPKADSLKVGFESIADFEYPAQTGRPSIMQIHHPLQLRIARHDLHMPLMFA